MIKFISKVLLFSGFLITSFFGVFLLENGTADPFYQRFVTPKQEALILGNSKAAKGIIPSILNERLTDVYPASLYNYSFTVYNSPFGPAYLESIKKKLAEYDGKRCFIITVDPWSISSDIDDPNDPLLFEENDGFISAIQDPTSNPNFDYLLNWFAKSYYEIPFMRIKNNLSLLHSDGWFETTGEMNEHAINERRRFMVNFYKAFLTKYTFSIERLKYLEKTIEYLKSKGDFYLLRMPLHKEILEIEERVDPEFDLKMKELSMEFSVPFFNFNSVENQWEFKDGLHLTIESARDFSEHLLDNLLINNNIDE